MAIPRNAVGGYGVHYDTLNERREYLNSVGRAVAIVINVEAPRIALLFEREKKTAEIEGISKECVFEFPGPFQLPEGGREFLIERLDAQMRALCGVANRDPSVDPESGPIRYIVPIIVGKCTVTTRNL